MPLGMLFTSPVAGPLASRFGRRPVLSVGALLLAVGGVCFGLATVVPLGRQGLMLLLVGCRVLQGAGSALMVTCLFAVLADAFPDNKGQVRQ
jgi:MFS family permease